MSDSYESFYGGGSSSLSPEYGNLTGYHMSAAQLGFPGSPQSADQLHDVVNAIKHGTKAFEVTMLFAKESETIPKQHFDEMRALMKLTGVKPSVHAPILDAAGFGEKGWTPDGRADNERRLFSAIERAQVLDPSGNLPIVIHAANGAPGTEWRPGKKGEDKFVMESSTMINQETGEIQAVKREEKWRPEVFDKRLKGEKGYGKAIMYNAESNVGSANRADWDNRLTEVAQMTKHAEELIGSAPVHLAEYKDAFITKGGIVRVDKDGNEHKLPEIDEKSDQVNSYNQMRKAGLFLDNAELSFRSTFGRAYKYGSDRQKEALKKLAEDYSEGLTAVSNMVWSPYERQKLLDQNVQKLQTLTSGFSVKGGREVRDKDFSTPKIFKLTEKFAMGEAARTFGNLATESYKKFGEKAPVLAIENMFQGMAFSRAEDMRELVDKSRVNFVEQLVEQEGVSKKKAEKLAEDKLGVTWDVGHLNIMRKKGFTAEDVVEQTKEIATKDKSMVKHIHLTDNFGYEDTHLLPGMGNVPIKAMMEELEKTGRLGEMRKIVEAGGMIQHFKKLPHSMTLAAMGSGIYGMKNGPTWDSAIDMQGAYFGGYGDLNPATHHQYFGAGFTTMPVELGGQQAGGQSRFGGTPMA